MSEKTSNGSTAEQSAPKDDKTEYVKPYMAKENDDLGYYFFPCRKTDEITEDKSTTTTIRNFMIKNFRMFGSAESDNRNCKINVMECVNRDPKVQIMLRALRAHGCPVDISRHISCEPCRMKISGGYDFYNSQVVVCENVVKRVPPTCNVLSHELLHAWDHCRAKYDPKNVEHLACTEIRAANIFHCHLGPSIMSGAASFTNLRDRHQDCVRNKATFTVQMARNVTEDEAAAIVEKVFARCYTDLEPFGRRPRKQNKGDCDRALQEGILYGYVE
ncbi:Mitochondrial inner membrane protease ATP23 [Mactra antiquata]